MVSSLTLWQRLPPTHMGDQFLVLAAGCTQPPTERHFGLVVDDRDEVRGRLEETGAETLRGGRGLDFHGPRGNPV
jgi:hypothetical protein